jgi:uncharacterized protein (TIGR03086 family)
VTDVRAAPSRSDGVALLERAVSYALGQLHAVTPAALSRPTPCARWDLRALLDHMNDSLGALHDAMRLRQVDLDPLPANPAADLVPLLRSRAGGLLGLLAGLGSVEEPGAVAGAGGGVVRVGGCPVQVALVACAGAMDVAVHGWDVGQACGAGWPIPQPLAQDMLEISPLLVTAADRPSRFAAPVLVSPRARASDRLVAYLGRSPG